MHNQADRDRGKNIVVCNCNDQKHIYTLSTQFEHTVDFPKCTHDASPFMLPIRNTKSATVLNYRVLEYFHIKTKYCRHYDCYPVDAPFIIYFLFNTTIEQHKLQIHNARLVCAKSQMSVCNIFSLSKETVKRNISFAYCFYAVYTRAAKHNTQPHSAKHSQKWYRDE